MRIGKINIIYHYIYDIIGYYKKWANMLKDKVFLTSTDTTIGFISQNRDRLNDIKKRPKDKKFITAMNSFDTLKKITRVPCNYKKMVRRSIKTTFIVKNESFRVINEKHHSMLLDRLKWAYTTSANLSGDIYNEEFAKENADVVVYPLKSKNTKASAIFKLGISNIKRFRG
ncbi:conserved hypothetical protein [Sulfurovum sp. enrichment culture clone C5]|uniref:YrdC-like domain-containing protein n=1 Tax=Sulfurovum sp. enrichment culture clone C5 TaxID=497650 RepID=A0A0S4XME6_9BACT|nr:conserved hypothetical protein [Sulfurovum sp. enrichment culture clone C5]